MPTTKLSDYKLSKFHISHTHLKFELDEEHTIITTTLQVKHQDHESMTPLVLDGGDFELISIQVNDKVLDASQYEIKNQKLTLLATPTDDFNVKIVTEINPTANTKLQGLYKTGDILTTHCEAEGFRNITFYLDRPDVLATFTTEIHADKTKFPVLLSNGNLDISRSGIDTENPNRHFITFENPVPIPSYLYAIVAGTLALRQDEFVTRSGRKVALKIFVPMIDLPKTEHAMQALKAAMRFDEEHYDREFDLDIYNIVGVPQFNAGAMENKGLNIFNNSSLLAHSTVSTDSGFEWVYGTIGHEYFHNWRGNRVTVKNWFQLSLKEGFASVTDQEFSQSVFGSMVSRIDDILALQNRQFKEDAGPLAHSVLPTEYEATDNIYTMTIYRKGAELINMLRTLIGKDAYKRGCNFYFAEHDGHAANIEDFLAAMEKASDRNLSQFLLWYQQAGTPCLEIEDRYDALNKTYELTISQSCPPTTGQPHKEPLLIPIAVALYDSAGNELPLQLEPDETPQSTKRVLELTKSKQTFKFVGINEAPIPSLLRNFSAPVKITKSPVTRTNNIFLLEHDSDPVNRWFAAQNISRDAIQSIITDIQMGRVCSVDKNIINAFRTALLNPNIEPRLKSQLINFPKVDSFFDFMKPADPDVIHRAREFFIANFIDGCYDALKTTYDTLIEGQTSIGYEPKEASLRKLKNACLGFLLQSNRPECIHLCMAQLSSAKNMTDRIGALLPLATSYHEEHVGIRQQELDKFIMKWKHEPLVLEHIFDLYARNEAPDAIDQIQFIYNNHIFDKANPSHAFQLLFGFYTYNAVRFHDVSGKGYKLIADCIIELDKINPSTASNLAAAFGNWKSLEPVRQDKMLEQLFRLDNLPLSDNVKELISKSANEASEMRAAQTLVTNPFEFFNTSAEGNTPGKKVSCTSPQLQ